MKTDTTTTTAKDSFAQSFRVCSVRNTAGGPSETFIDAYECTLPFSVTSLYGESALPTHAGTDVLHYPGKFLRKARNAITSRLFGYDKSTLCYIAAFRRLRPHVVIAQYGHVGVRVSTACRACSIPLIVFFRGYDAHADWVIERFGNQYASLFQQAFAIVAVSQAIRTKLLEMGADSEKVFYSPSGVDCNKIVASNPRIQPPHFLAVGRLVDKKGPHLTLIAFAKALQQVPGMRLTLVGEGPLASVCRDIVRSLGLQESVNLIGSRAHDEVLSLMRESRGFLQHSLVAFNGDSEGTPNSIMEASASALPVIATRHGGIPEVVLHGETGYLVQEHDVVAMSENICRIAVNPDLAYQLGIRGREHMVNNFTRKISLERLVALIDATQRAAASRVH
jgi:colanic acid/amylovoran biosynthesis glycosyltransferase